VEFWATLYQLGTQGLQSRTSVAQRQQGNTGSGSLKGLKLRLKSWIGHNA
jgi:hypothetical protein